MATIEHSIYCFETLSAKLESRNPLTLEQVHQTWSEYTSATQKPLPSEGPALPTDSNSSKVDDLRNPVIQRLLDSSNSATTSRSSTPSSASASTTISESSLRPSASSSATSITDPPSVITPSSSHPLFVTWNTISPTTSSHTLRGCIGTFAPEPLTKGLSSYALISALHDTRFSPITLAELPSLSCTVTLLTNFEDCAEPLDWVVGEHGIRISFTAGLPGVGMGEKRFGACYLPDVASEQGWGREETLVSAMRKAGWMGRRANWKDVGELKVVRFRGGKVECGYEDFRAWREWVDEKGR